MLTRDQLRSRRPETARARTFSVYRAKKSDLRRGAYLYPEQPGIDYARPKTRAECVGGPRPCPFVSCKYHLYLDVQARTGAIKLNFPDIEVEEMTESCSLDVADRGGATLEEVGAIMNLTRERVRQLEEKLMATATAAAAALNLKEHLDEPPARRRLPVLQPRLAK